MEDKEAVKSVVMGLLEDGWTVQLFKRPGDYAIRAYKIEQ